MRKIEDVLDFRGDISPFLTHLTRGTENKQAKEILEDIISSRQLLQSGNKTSSACYGCIDIHWDDTKKKSLFSSISFTETPLNEIHCLLEIENRQIELEPYGLVFIKKNLMKKNISPVLYLNNYGENIDNLIHALGDIVTQNDYPEELHKIFPLISSMGNMLTPRNGPSRAGTFDFSWEREWRRPYCYGSFEIDFENDIFIGLCPHDEITHFEEYAQRILGHQILFIDPQRNAKWYAKKLIERRRKFGLTLSVV